MRRGLLLPCFREVAMDGVAKLSHRQRIGRENPAAYPFWARTWLVFPLLLLCLLPLYAAEVDVAEGYPCLRQLEQITAGGARMPAWMSDGEHFLITRSQEDGIGEILCCQKKGNALAVSRRLSGRSPVSNRDDCIAFVQRAKDVDRIMVAEKGTQTPQPLVELRGTVSRLSWSPDGKYLAYVLMSADGLGQLNIFSLAEKKEETLDLAGCLDCAWSPDGLTMAVVRSRPVLGCELTAVLMDGHRAKVGSAKLPEVRVLVSRQAVEISCPSWSADSKHIAYVERSGKASDIYVYSFSGANRRQFTFDGADNIEPAWSPDGRSILFASRRAGMYHEVWKIHLIFTQTAR